MIFENIFGSFLVTFDSCFVISITIYVHSNVCNYRLTRYYYNSCSHLDSTFGSDEPREYDRRPPVPTGVGKKSIQNYSYECFHTDSLVSSGSCWLVLKTLGTDPVEK